jgi:hypothetical protein
VGLLALDTTALKVTTPYSKTSNPKNDPVRNLTFKPHSKERAVKAPLEGIAFVYASAQFSPEYAFEVEVFASIFEGVRRHI